jgi:hypothetical protein
MIYNTVTLPLERHRLNWLEKQPHSGLDLLAPILNPEAAAMPSQQPE